MTFQTNRKFLPQMTRGTYSVEGLIDVGIPVFDKTRKRKLGKKQS